MDVLRARLKSLCVMALALAGGTGCQMTYVMKSAKSHLSILWDRMPLEEALKDPRLSEEERNKLLLAREARVFGLEHLHLKKTANYTRFSYLDRPHVSYVVSAAPKWKLESHEWSYPFVGKMPYKGFASERDAKDEKKKLEEQGLDTALRGVSAYSTLGWFEDPILSTMLKYSDQGIVNLILHESTHATLYIKNSADFNERLAVFVGNQGTEEFFRAKEGERSPTLKKIRELNEDDSSFSAFIGPELQKLRDWYESLPVSERDEKRRGEKFREIQDRFVRDVKPLLKTKAYDDFPGLSLNNARLLYYKTYMTDLSDFEKLYALTGKSWKRFQRCVKTLEASKDPKLALKELNKSLESDPKACPP